MLADIAVNCIEQQRRESHQTILLRFSDQLFVCRYVDNRLVVFSEQIIHQSWLFNLCELDFYQKPVELEKVETGEFLGTILHRA